MYLSNSVLENKISIVHVCTAHEFCSANMLLIINLFQILKEISPENFLSISCSFVIREI